jgi:hypothetical protein
MGIRVSAKVPVHSASGLLIDIKFSAAMSPRNKASLLSLLRDTFPSADTSLNMPAERTRSLKKEKEDADGEPLPPSSPRSRLIVMQVIQLTWTDTLESLPASQQIAFAPAVTPGTFTEESLVDGTESLPSLFPSTPMVRCHESQDTGRKRRKTISRDPRTPSYSSARPLSRVGTFPRRSRPTTARCPRSSGSPGKTCRTRSASSGTARRSSRRPSTSASSPTTRSVRRMCGARVAPPLPRRRKVREVGPKDMKRCAKIAQLLVEGKKGADLQAAVEEFDKNHVPIIVTRFDTPITARSFRRSVSEPAPDTDPSAPAFLRPDPKVVFPPSQGNQFPARHVAPVEPCGRSRGLLRLLALVPLLLFCLWLLALCEYRREYRYLVGCHLERHAPSCAPSRYPSRRRVRHKTSTFSCKCSLDSSIPMLSSCRPSSSSRISTHSFFNEAPATCIDSIDPLSPALDNEPYGAFHADTPVSCTSTSFGVSGLSSTCPSWTRGRPRRSPAHHVRQSTIQGSNSPPWTRCRHRLPQRTMIRTTTSWPSWILVAAVSRNVAVRVPWGQRSGATLWHTYQISNTQQQQQSIPYFEGVRRRRHSSSSVSHKLPVPEVPAMDITGYADMFASAQSFSF